MTNFVLHSLGKQRTQGRLAGVVLPYRQSQISSTHNRFLHINNVSIAPYLQELAINKPTVITKTLKPDIDTVHQPDRKSQYALSPHTYLEDSSK